MLASFAAHRGYLALPWVITVAFAGTLCGDQLLFYLGRRHSEAVIAKYPAWQIRVDKVYRWVEHYPTLLILAFRFLYGLRTVTPFVIGMSRVPTRKFIFFNVIGALVWSVVVGTGGFLFGNALEIIIGDIKHYELEALGAIAIIGAMIWTIHFYRRRRHKAGHIGSSLGS